MCAFLRDPKNIYYQRDVENNTDQVLGFLLFDKNEHTHGILRSAILVCLCNFFFLSQDLIDRINTYFQRIAFQRNLRIIGF